MELSIEENRELKSSFMVDKIVLDVEFNITPPKIYVIKVWINPIIKSKAKIKA